MNLRSSLAALGAGRAALYLALAGFGVLALGWDGYSVQGPVYGLRNYVAVVLEPLAPPRTPPLHFALADLLFGAALLLAAGGAMSTTWRTYRATRVGAILSGAHARVRHPVVPAEPAGRAGADAADGPAGGATGAAPFEVELDAGGSRAGWRERISTIVGLLLEQRRHDRAVTGRAAARLTPLLPPPRDGVEQ